MRMFSDFRLFLLLAALAAGPCAHAQDAASAPPADELELLDESEQPTITIRKPDARQEIIERREPGITREVKVQSGGSTYYLYPNDPLGSSFRDSTSTMVRPALWRVHEFDITGQRPDNTGDEFDSGDDYTSDAPAPPAAK